MDTCSKQSPLDLKVEVLNFVKDLRNLINVSKLFPYSEYGHLSQFTNPICVVFTTNYLMKAYQYRSKIDEVLGIKLYFYDPNYVRAHPFWGDTPYSLNSIAFIANDLEIMAEKITK